MILPLNEKVTLKYLKDGRLRVVCKMNGIIHTLYFLPNANFSFFNDRFHPLFYNDSVDKTALYLCSQLKNTYKIEDTSKSHIPYNNIEGKKQYRIVIDPGHGGKFTGTSGMSLTEKDLNLDISIRIYNLLKDKYSVVLTRTTDMELKDSLVDDLNERVNIGHKIWADLFISIHHNFAHNPSVRGFEIYLPTFSNWIEKTKKIELISSHLKNKGFKNRAEYYQHLKTSTNTIAGIIAKKLSNFLPSNGIKNKNLRVLRENLVPAILVEVEYLSNTNAENFLLDVYNRQKIAKALSESIDEYFTYYINK